MTLPTIDEVGCLAVALERCGVDIHHVNRGGFVMERASYGYDFYLGDHRALEALPLAHRLHTKLTGMQSEYFKEWFKVVARRQCCDLDWPTIMEMLETFDDGPVDQDLVEEAHRYGRIHARRHRIENQWYKTVLADPVRRSMRHA